MKNLVVLNYVNCNDYSFEKIFNIGNTLFSASELVLAQACKLEFCEKILLLVKNSEQKEFFEKKLSENLEIEIVESLTVASLVKLLAEKSEGFENIVYEMGDCPFYNIPLSKKIFELHDESKAEYTFADGYSYGFAPEILNSGTARILNGYCQKNEKWNSVKVTKESLFELLKTDINSFEIETYISDCDYRANRFNFSCSNKNNMQSCRILLEKFVSAGFGNELLSINNFDVEKLSEFSETLDELQQVLPQYYSIQICACCAAQCSFCPYPQAFKEKFGFSANEKSDGSMMMKFEDFSPFVDKIADFSGEAVVCLSLWGEAVLHPELDKFVEKILSYRGLSVMIELSGQKFDESVLDRICSIVKNAEERSNGYKKIYWIVSLDGVDSKKYDELHNFGKSNENNSYEIALRTLSLLMAKFPECVYPQFLRLKENEDSLESFWRTWNEQNGGNLIIKKYDWFSGLLEQKKTADLAPVNRNVCWHLRRDFNILVDGSVPLCQGFLLDGSQGNVFKESLESVWEKRRELIKNQMKSEYIPICEKCDEYYIFNF